LLIQKKELLKIDQEERLLEINIEKLELQDNQQLKELLKVIKREK
jgi:hypothetical protein